MLPITLQKKDVIIFWFLFPPSDVLHPSANLTGFFYDAFDTMNLFTGGPCGPEDNLQLLLNVHFKEDRGQKEKGQ